MITSLFTRRFATALAVLAVLSLVFSTSVVTTRAASVLGAPAGAKASKSKKFDPTCGKSTRTITDVMSHQVTITGTPKRVVTLELSFIDAMASVGLTPVGSADDNNPNEITFQVRSRLGYYKSVGLRQNPNLEIISSLHPDLILADLQRHKTIYDQLSKIAPTLVLNSLQASYTETMATMKVVAEAMNRCGAMNQRLKQHTALMKQYAKQVPSKFKHMRVLFAVTWDKGFNEHNSQAYTPGVLETLGVHAAIQGQPGSPYNDMNLETLAQANPDAMFLARQTPATVLDGWKTNPLWSAINAVKNRQVWYVNPITWSKWRGIIGSEIIARQLIKDLRGKGSAG